ncbi:MAG: adenylate/guanylate cyclase domain-containing protein [Myxococcota bacterium]|nr:adenylate/guanylate cyclase domain-containing protein [Myxococcota bacterium]
MSVEVSGKLTFKDMLGDVGGVPIPQQRFFNVAWIRLLIGIPATILPTQIFMRGRLDQAWAPEWANHALDVHLLALLVYIPANLALVWFGQSGRNSKRSTLRALNHLCILCELVTTQAFLVAQGNLDNYGVSYLVVLVVLYRALFEYSTAVLTLCTGTAFFVVFSLIEVAGIIPSAPLLPYAIEHPILNSPILWIMVIYSTPLSMFIAFCITNYAVNQTARLHDYMTRSVLQRYLPPALVEKAARGELRLDALPERREVTVMFTDIVGFTALSERLGPVAVGSLINTLLGEIADIALAHGATVDKFIGDCVMVVFGAPEPCDPEEQVARSIKLALAIQQKVTELGSEYQLQARTGLNTGDVVVGNFGSMSRSDYTVLGPTVNVAARLEAKSLPGRILIGPHSAHLLGDAWPLETTGPIKLKGVSNPIEAYFVGK